MVQPQGNIGMSVASTGVSTIRSGVFSPRPSNYPLSMGQQVVSTQNMDRIGSALRLSKNSPLLLQDLVDQKIKEQIWTDQLPSLSLLFKPNNSASNLTLIAKLTDEATQSGHPFLVPGTRHPQLKNFDEWLEAFFIFVSVYTQKFPHEIAPLMKYGETIRDLSKSGGNWLFYDETFRKLRPVTRWSWASFEGELWHKSVSSRNPQVPQQSNNFRGQSSRRTFVKGNSTSQSTFVPRGWCVGFHNNKNWQGLCGYSQM